MNPLLSKKLSAACNAPLKAGIDFNFYRTRDKAEIDLIIDTSSGHVPIDIKLGSKLNRRMLRPMQTFIADTGAKFGILVNSAEKIEMVSDNIVQIPATYF